MSEINSRQAAKIVAGQKVLPAEATGKKRVLVVGTPDTHALQNGDTIASGIALPVGTRFSAGSLASFAAMGTDVTLDVGIRDFKTKVAIDADGIATAVAVATAGRSAINNGALVKDGAEYVTTVVSEVYLTIGGANPTANAQLRAEIEYICKD